MKYEILIGELIDENIDVVLPKRTVIINEAQKNILLFFATKRIDAEVVPIYGVNGCEFRIAPHFMDEPYFKEQTENQ